MKNAPILKGKLTDSRTARSDWLSDEYYFGDNQSGSFARRYRLESDADTDPNYHAKHVALDPKPRGVSAAAADSFFLRHSAGFSVYKSKWSAVWLSTVDR